MDLEIFLNRVEGGWFILNCMHGGSGLLENASIEKSEEDYLNIHTCMDREKHSDRDSVL